MKYAAKTTVSPEKTRAEIEVTLKRFGADGFAFSIERDLAIVMFKMNKRTLRFTLKLPVQDGSRKSEQDLKQLWRSLFASIKGKLVSVESNVELFEETFLANIVMPDGKTVGEHVIPKIEPAYLESGGMPQLLLGSGGQ